MQMQQQINIEENQVDHRPQNLSQEMNLRTEDFAGIKSQVPIDNQEHQMVQILCLKKQLREHFNRLLDDNASIKQDNDQQKLKAHELQELVKTLETMEDMLMKQSDIQKKEISDLRKQIKNSTEGKEKEHIKQTFLQWLILLSKQ